MLTYLAIFLSLVALGGVFGRRLFLVYKSRQVVEKGEADADDVKKSAKKNSMAKVSRSDKSRVLGLCEKAESLLKSGKEEEAIRCFVQALSILPEDADVQQKLAMLYMQKQMFAPAAALFRQLAALTQDAVHYSHLGFAHFKQAEYDEAKNAYQKAVELDEERPARFVSLGQVYRSLGQPYHAIIAISKAIALDGENKDYLFLLSDLKKEIEEYEEALEILGVILESDPENLEAKILRNDVKKILSAKGEE